MNKTIISSRQFTLLMSGFVFGTAPLLLSSRVAVLAGPDSWISTIIATIFGLFVVWVNSVLGELHPEKTFIEVMPIVLGKWLGGLMSVCYILLTFIAGAQIIWYEGDFFTTVYMTGASNYYINILFIAVVAIALIYGVEVMFRASEIIFLFAFPLFIISLLMLTPQIKINNFLPILENGIGPAIKGVIPILNITAMNLINFNMLFPANMENLKQAKKAMFLGYFLGIIPVNIAIAFCIMVLGSAVTAELRFPLFTIMKEINIGTIFTRLDALMVSHWLVTNFLTTFIFLYTSIKGLSQLLKLKDYKTLVLPVCLIVVAYSGFIYKNVPHQIRWDNVSWTPVAITFGFLIPVLLLIVSLIRKKLGRQQEV